MEGLHGIGKSQIVEQFAEESDIHLEILFLSHQEVGDLIGIPETIMLDGVSVTTWSVPIWLQRMKMAAKQGKKCALFLDELNRAPLDVRQSALQLVLEGKLHEHALPMVDGVKTFICSAINPSDAYQVDELDPALLDRFLHINIEADSKTWLKYARETNVNSMVRDFIAEYPDRLHCQSADGLSGTSPRSWVKTGAYMDVIDRIPAELLFGIMKGKLGVEIGSQFFSFVKNYVNVVKVQDIVDIVEKNSETTKDIEELALIIKDKISKTESIQKMELANQICDYEKDNKTFVLLSFLYSLEIETCVSLLKEYRASKQDLYRDIAVLDGELNDKALFKRIVKAAALES
jgi:hypothetical protein